MTTPKSERIKLPLVLANLRTQKVVEASCDGVLPQGELNILEHGREPNGGHRRDE